MNVGAETRTRSAMSDLMLPSNHPRGFGRALLLALPVTVAALVLYRDLYTGSTPPAVTNREVLSMNMALNARFCGTSRELSSRYSPYQFLATRRDLMQRPFADLIVAHAGSIPDYCRTVTEPYVLAENSVMWLARSALRLRNSLTPDGLSQLFGALRVSMILIFGFALIRTGVPLVVAVACVLVGCEILRGVGIRETPYPFLLALPLLHAACYGLANASRLATNRTLLSVFALGMGILTAFSASVRTILLPMGAAMFGVFLFAECRIRTASHIDRPLRSAVIATLAFGIGHTVYVRALIDPLRIENDLSAYTYHTVAHPLVLGLAVPESTFTQREGIQWNDMVGLALARRIAPDIDLLGPGYETSLFRYYRRLWREHPREMLMVYLGKLCATGRGVFLSVAAVGSQFGIPSAPAAWLDRMTNGMMLVAFALVTFGFALHRHLDRAGGGMLMIALISLAALAALGEAFLMHSLYLSAYYSELLFFVIVAPLFWLQAAADRVARAWLPVPDQAITAGPAL
jgi:hypothetical protein